MTLRNLAKAQLTLLIGGFLALALAIALSGSTPVTGYEPSTYEATPLIWVLLGLALGLGSLQTVVEASTRSFRTRTFLYLGVALVLFARLTANFVGLIRGYFFVGRTDNLTHWGFALGIEEAGRTDPNNIYPLMHILLAQGSRLTGTSVQAMMVVLPAALGILATVCIYLILRRLFKDERVVALGTLSASLLLFGGAGPESSSSGFSLILIPFLLYLYLRSRTSVGFRIPLVVLLIAYPFIHPLTSLLLIAFLASGEIVLWRLGRPQPRSTPVVLLSLAFLSWFSATVAFGHTVRSVASLLSGDFQTSYLGVYQAQAAQAALPLTDFAVFLVISYADWFIFLLAGFTAVLILRRRGLFTGRASVIPLIIPFSLLAMASLYLINLGFDPIRFVAFLMVGSVLYAGILLVRILGRVPRQRLRGVAVAAVAALIITAGVISVYKSHASPHVLRPGSHVTQAEVLGYFWFFANRDPSTTTFDLLSGANRFAHTFAGSFGLAPLVPRAQTSPDHFGYDEPGGAGAPRSGYLVVTAMDIATYTGVWDFTGRFTNEDFARLKDDATVHRVYDSGTMQIYLVP